ncbi:DUF3987 domain-containing protein [Pantanalinema sp. GBBB05]|uniref:DUF3987 domain-containing protein n=1 Tax=Pantanalinema sp. GBBB05 TaxID=2604139 RepID=UPI001DB64E49|nr:DUF3987 domain-containing protein [Pantanalinema sp. GBBB05]
MLLFHLNSNLKSDQQGININQAIAHLKAAGFQPGDVVWMRLWLPKDTPIELAKRLKLAYQDKQTQEWRLSVVSGFLTLQEWDKASFTQVFGNKGTRPFSNGWKQIEVWNRKGYGVGFIPNRGGKKDDEINDCWCLFYEIDDRGFEDQISTLRSLENQLGHQATFVLKTRKSLHCWFRLAQKVDPSTWKNYQQRLALSQQSDGSLDDPSQLMRLAGFLHQSCDGESTNTWLAWKEGVEDYKDLDEQKILSHIWNSTPVSIVQDTGEVFSLEEFDRILPPLASKSESSNHRDLGHSFKLPDHETVPLEICLSRANRELLERGQSEGSRNQDGFALACDLIGVANSLRDMGQRFTGDPYHLFLDYCDRCHPPLPESERNSIWNSAEKEPRESALNLEYLTNCVKGYLWRQSRSNLSLSRSESHLIDQKDAALKGQAELPPVQSFKQEIENILKRNLSNADRLIALAALANDYGRPLRDIQQIVAAIEAEADLEDAREETEAEIIQLTSLAVNQIQLSDCLPVHLADPLTKALERAGSEPLASLMAFLTISASLLPTGTAIEPYESDPHQERAILYFGLVAEPSSRKSGVLKQLTQPLQAIQGDLKQQYDQAYQQYQEELEQWKQEGKESRREKPIEPQLEHVYIEDATSEGVATILSHQQHRGLLSNFDELKGLFGLQDAYRNGKGADRQKLLSLYDGGSLKVDRTTKHLFVEKTAISILGSIQPSVLLSLMGDYTDSDGTWSRFQWVVLPIRRYDYPEGARIDISPLLQGIYRQLRAFPVKVYRYSPEAQELFRRWYNWLEDKRIAEYRPAQRSLLGKVAGQTSRIALVLHSVEAATNQQEPSEEIQIHTLRAAIAIKKALLQQTELIYSEAGVNQGELSPILVKILDILKRKKQLSARDLSRCWTTRQKPLAKQFEVWMQELIQLNLVREGRTKQGKLLIKWIESHSPNHHDGSDSSDKGTLSIDSFTFETVTTDSDAVMTSQLDAVTNQESVTTDESYVTTSVATSVTMPESLKGLLDRCSESTVTTVTTESESNSYTPNSDEVEANSKWMPKVGDLVIYVGDDQKFNRVADGKTLRIEVIKEDKAVLGADGWYVKHTKLISELRKVV